MEQSAEKIINVATMDMIILGAIQTLAGTIAVPVPVANTTLTATSVQLGKSLPRAAVQNIDKCSS